MENVLMDRIQFIGQAHKGRILSTDELIAFFDHMMCAYDIVGVVDNTSIEGSTDNLLYTNLLCDMLIFGVSFAKCFLISGLPKTVF